MSSFVRFFTKRKSHKEKDGEKEENNQFPNRDRPGRYSLRESSQKHHNSNNNPYVNTMAIMDPETWQKPAAPYRILTEPRTKRPVQSCPGGVAQPSTSKPPPSYRSNAKRDLSTHFEQEMSQDLGSSILCRPTTSSNWQNQSDSLRNRSNQRAGTMNNTFRQRNALDKTLQNSTSEYGSADPSPTMPFPQVDDTSFTDGDSDTDSAMPAHLIRHYEKEMRKLKRKARDYKERAIRYKEEAYHYRQMMNELYTRIERYEESLQREQNISRQLNSRVREANMKINELKRVIGDRQDLVSRNLCPNCVYSGAGEAMCSRTELHMNSPNLAFNQLSNPLNLIPENSMFSPRFSHNNDSADEIKNFRTVESGSDRDHDQIENIEPARDASTNSYLLVDDEIGLNKRPIPLVQEEPPALSKPNPIYENFLNMCSARENNDDTIHVEVEENVDQGSMTSSTMTPMKMRRSFSDSDLNALAQMSIEQNTSSPIVQNGNPQRRPCTPMHRFGSGMHLHKRSRKFRHLSTDEDTSSLSSDEELVKVIEKQLRRKGGDVVRFRPPRKAVTKKFFSRFGPNERRAIEQFEYLHDLTTDISGLGSPDPSPKP